MKSRYEYGDKVHISHLDEEGEIFCYVKFGIYAVYVGDDFILLNEKDFEKI